jgi:hypothetical protein
MVGLEIPNAVVFGETVEEEDGKAFSFFAVMNGTAGRTLCGLEGPGSEKDRLIHGCGGLL